jgi:hypothetical protein
MRNNGKSNDDGAKRNDVQQPFKDHRWSVREVAVCHWRATSPVRGYRVSEKEVIL